MADLSAWLLSIGSFALVVLSVALAARALAGDPPRGRRRCPRCWHELGPLPEDALRGPGQPGDPARDAAARRARRCSECGFEAADERDTGRTRRRPLLAALAIAFVVAFVLILRVRMFNDGPWSLVPTRVLLATSSLVGDGGYHSPQSELSLRIGLGKLDDAQLADAVDLVVRGDRDAPPGSDGWTRKYGELCAKLLTVVPADEPLVLRFLEIPPRLEVEYLPARANRPGLLVMDADAYWPRQVEARVALELPDGSTRRARFEPFGAFNTLSLPIEPSAADVARVRTTVRVRPLGAGDDAWRTFAPVDFALPKPSESGRETAELAPTDTPAARSVVEGTFGDNSMLVVWAEGNPRAGLIFDASIARGVPDRAVAFGLRAEVLERGVVRRTSRIFWCTEPDSVPPRAMAPVEDPDAMARLAAQDPALDVNWTLRISGDETLAEYARPKQAPAAGAPPIMRWSGSIEIPLRVERRDRPSPVRRWMLEPSP